MQKFDLRQFYIGLAAFIILFIWLVIARSCKKNDYEYYERINNNQNEYRVNRTSLQHSLQG